MSAFPPCDDLSGELGSAVVSAIAAVGEAGSGGADGEAACGRTEDVATVEVRGTTAEAARPSAADGDGTSSRGDCGGGPCTGQSAVLCSDAALEGLRARLRASPQGAQLAVVVLPGSLNPVHSEHIRTPLFQTFQTSRIDEC